MASTVEADHIAYVEKYQQSLEREHLGKIALMNEGKVVGIYNDMGDAYSIGYQEYGLGNFSMKKIGQRPAHLGILAITL